MAGASSTPDAGSSNGDILNSHQTRVLPMSMSNITVKHTDSSLTDLSVDITPNSREAAHLSMAASALRTSSTPVAFPTETVYGLGADATRSDAVRGIFTTKNRPVDNPLIVHICSLSQLRSLLSSPDVSKTGSGSSNGPDPIPAIYHPLIQRFWPGPLTILLPTSSRLAPEVTASLPTFGARMPSSPLALALIHASGLPLAAPSANASTRPSPTRAAHVLHDLKGRIDLILDGGDCHVGVESTVVDGLSDPPAVLRPGGVSLQQIRSVKGWEETVVAYKDADESRRPGDGAVEQEKPRAPGMKYKHYAPTAKVVLVKAGLVDDGMLKTIIAKAADAGYKHVGVLRGPRWRPICSQPENQQEGLTTERQAKKPTTEGHDTTEFRPRRFEPADSAIYCGHEIEIIDAGLGRTTEALARNLFRGFREMDLQGVDLILVEALADDDGDGVAAVMNRLKKAAEMTITSLETFPF